MTLPKMQIFGLHHNLAQTETGEEAEGTYPVMKVSGGSSALLQELGQ